jgi:hypothetical protein
MEPQEAAKRYADARRRSRVSRFDYADVLERLEKLEKLMTALLKE